jgi:hypothetical protein
VVDLDVPLAIRVAGPGLIQLYFNKRSGEPKVLERGFFHRLDREHSPAPQAVPADIKQKPRPHRRGFCRLGRGPAGVAASAGAISAFRLPAPNKKSPQQNEGASSYSPRTTLPAASTK